VKELLKRLLARFGLYLTKGYTVYWFSNKKIVRRELYGKNIRMPRSHSIGYNLAHFPYYNSNLQRLVSQYQLYRTDDFSIIDVGANIGDTLLMLRQATDHPIHCFEGDPFYFRLLEENAKGIGNCYLHPRLLSDKPTTLKVRNRISLGTSEFTHDDAGDLTEFSSIDAFAAAHFPKEPIGVIKSDTDGFDLRIIRGAAATIAAHHPLLFIEYDRVLFEKNGDEGLSFLEFLAGLDYQGVLFYDNFGKLVCVTSLGEKSTIRSLHDYIRNPKNSFPFYDLAIVPRRDQAFLESFSAAELNFFEG
jgi:FkbM family methyltransferase